MALLASGSTNHTLHLVAIARAAGITLTWDDLSDLSAVVPSLCRIYPNGEADVNHFHAAGGIAFLVHTLLRAGCSTTTSGPWWAAGCGTTPPSRGCAADENHVGGGPKASLDESVLRSADDPFAPDGGLRMSSPVRSAVR